MNTVQRLIFLLSILLIISCERDYTTPIDIFEQETLDDSVRLATSTNQLFVNSDRIEKFGDSYQIKGTIFAQSRSGLIPVSSGDFMLYNSGVSTSKGLSDFSIDGYGTFEFPREGVMSQFDNIIAEGSEIYYNSGEFFKSLPGKSKFPLDDDIYYFHYQKDTTKTSNPTTGSNKERKRKIKNTGYIFKEYYLDVSDPKVLIYGDYKTKTNLYKDLWCGLSANYTFDFQPKSYSSNLSDNVGDLGFENFDANLYLSGKIPIKKYNLQIEGEAFISTKFGNKGEYDFFESGIEDAEYRIGCNADLYLDSKLVRILTEPIHLANATLQAEFIDNNAELRLAGEYTNVNYVEKVLGKTASQFLSSREDKGYGYLRIGDDLDRFILYLEQEVSLNTKLSGTLACQNSVIKCTMDAFELKGIVDLPYDIGEFEVTGLIEKSGNFSFSGDVDAVIDVGYGVKFQSNVRAEITQESIALEGMMNLPYGIGDVLVKGNITDNGLFLEGEIDSGIDLGNGLTVPAKLKLTIDSNNGVKISGDASLPYGIGTIAVLGGISTSELHLSGSFNSHLGFGDVNLISSKLGVSISTSSGVTLAGSIVLPLEFSTISVVGHVDASDLVLSGNADLLIGYKGIGLQSNLDISASVVNGIRLNGEIDFRSILDINVEVNGILSYDDIQLSGTLNGGLGFSLCGVNVNASTGLAMTIGKKHGVSIAGDITFPFGGLGKANVMGTLNPGKCFDVSGSFVQNLSIKEISISASELSFTGSCKSGFSINGDIDFPLGLGNIHFGGLASLNGFYLEGSTSINLVVAKPSLAVRIEPVDVSIEVDLSAASLEFDWGEQKLKVCILGACFP
jgi:hypothetical protein